MTDEHESSTYVSADLSKYSETLRFFKTSPQALGLSVLRTLFAKGCIDTDRFDDADYLWATISSEFRAVVPEVMLTRSIYDPMLKAADEAIESDERAVAIILIATAVEHVLNLHLHDFFELKGLTREEISTVLRSNMHSKISWLLKLVDMPALSPHLVARIKTINRLRNTVVHYHPKPMTTASIAKGEDSLRDDLDSVDIDELFLAVDELEYELSWMLIGGDVNLQWAVRVFTTYVDDQPGQLIDGFLHVSDDN